MAIQHWRIRDRYYRLIGSKCLECGTEFFPPVYVCKRCGSEKIEDSEMPKVGKIITHTELHEPMPGFEDQAPFFLAIIELPNGARVLSEIVDSPEDAVKTGAKVRAVTRRVRVDGESGQILYGYKFIVE